MTESKRRTEEVGDPMFVVLPTGWKNTGEGGMSFYLAVKCKDFDHKRNITCEGSVLWRSPDVCISKRGFQDNQLVDACMLIGSTGQSLFDGDEYFMATRADLTDKGKALYDIMCAMYGKDSVEIITLLDT